MIVSTDFDIKEKELIVSYYDEAGDMQFLRKKLHESDMFNWNTTSTPSEYRNWDGRFLEKVPSKFVSRFRCEEIIQTRLTQSDREKLFAIHNPKKYYLDIEIDLQSTDFPDPERALMPVGLITIVNPDNTVYVLSTMSKFGKEKAELTKKLTEDTNEYFASLKNNPATAKLNVEFNVKYMEFETEVELMECFFHKMMPKIPFLTGWNVIGFDWLYLVNRCARINVDITKNLPGKLIGKARMLSHFGLVDYMEVFKNIKPFKVVENYKLDYIANLVLGVAKLKTNYNSMLEAQKDRYNFALYNVIDTVLVKLMEDKLDLLSVVFSISTVAGIEVSKVFSNVFLTETLMCREFLTRNKLMANDKRAPIEDMTYDGAFVMPPVPGYYQYVACYDFASMYPNIQIQFNISPDAYLGKGAPKPTEIHTKNNTRFTNQFDSAARKILTNLYNERVNTKKLVKQLKELRERKANEMAQKNIPENV